jgi:hypothetical protein
VFELVCMLSSLSDTEAGKARVGAPGMVGVLVALLPVATPRVQRQVLLILRRVLLLVDPKAVDDKVTVPGGLLRASLEAKLTAEAKKGADAASADQADGDALAAATAKAEAEQKRAHGRGSTVAALLMCYAKALALQVRGRADGRPVMTNATLSDDLFPGHVGQVRCPCRECAFAVERVGDALDGWRRVGARCPHALFRALCSVTLRPPPPPRPASVVCCRRSPPPSVPSSRASSPGTRP